MLTPVAHKGSSSQYSHYDGVGMSRKTTPTQQKAWTEADIDLLTHWSQLSKHESGKLPT